MKRRSAFTLIEMMVSMALTIFLMVILAQCFVAAMDTFRQLKAVGDMEGSLRTASTILRRDLASDHFEGKRRLSDPSFWVQGPPREGFFRIYQGSLPQNTQPATGYYDEGPDADGIHSFLATDHMLHFTVKLRGNQRPNFFSTTLGDPNSPLLSLGQPDSRFQVNTPPPVRTPPYLYSSPWAEVAYFLAPTLGVTANGTPLYALYRRQRLAVPTNDGVNWTNQPGAGLAVTGAALASYPQVSCWYNGVANRTYFNSPTDLTVPGRRFANSNPKQYLPLGTGNDLLLTSVVSFEAKVLFGGASRANGFINLYQLPGSISISNPAFASLTGPRAYDTWTSIQDDADHTNYTGWNKAGTPQSVPIAGPGVSISAISITLRVWDVKTQQTRQVTIVQDM